MTRLRNTEALRQMLDGTHRTQTKKSFFMSDTKSENDPNGISRKPGDVWTETDPVTGEETHWKQEKGFKRKIGVMEAIRHESPELFSGMQMPSHCPHCDKNMSGVADTRMWSLYKMCIDCVAKRDTKLMYEGKFGDFQIQKMQENVKAWIRDTDQEFEDMIANIKKDPSYVNADGTLEKWDLGSNVEEQEAQLRADYADFRNRILQYYGIQENETA